jgi:predicted RNA-binding Zn ribbon-like protein
VIRVTWEWLGQDPALDLANTVAIENGVERDLWSRPGSYERWAAAEGAAGRLEPVLVDALVGARAALIEVRAPVRDVVAARSVDREPSADAVRLLNAASRSAPEWLEIDPASWQAVTRLVGPPHAQVAATYARSALRLAVADSTGEVRRCGAPSCGMFFRPTRSDQAWCSRQCGTRARVARHGRRLHLA